MSLSLYDQVTNVLCEPFGTRHINTIIQFVANTLSTSSLTLATAVVMHCVRSFALTGSGGTKLCFWYIPTRRNHKALDPDFLVANVSVPCSGLLSRQSNVEADFDPGNFEPVYSSEAELHLGWKRSFHHSLTHGAEPFLRRCQLCSYSRTSQHFMEHGVSLPCSQEPSTGPYPEPDRPNPYHPILSLSDTF
jgi:hypothetical protein